MVSGSSSSSLLALLAVLLALVVSVVIVPLAVEAKELYDGAAAGLNDALVDAASLLLLVVDAEIMLLWL